MLQQSFTCVRLVRVLPEYARGVPFPFSLSTRKRAPEGGLKALADSASGRPTTIFATACKRTLATHGNLTFTASHTPEFDSKILKKARGLSIKGVR